MFRIEGPRKTSYLRWGVARIPLFGRLYQGCFFFLKLSVGTQSWRPPGELRGLRIFEFRVCGFGA